MEDFKEVKDTGARTTFDTGSSKEILSGRGRYDLLPHNTIRLLLGYWVEAEDISTQGFNMTQVLGLVMGYIHEAIAKENITEKVEYLLYSVIYMTQILLDNDIYKVIEDLARLYEAGAVKYSARDWEKGRPMNIFIDSALRHLVQHAQGKEDENHLIAVIWNLISCADTIVRLPELALTLNHK